MAKANSRSQVAYTARHRKELFKDLENKKAFLPPKRKKPLREHKLQKGETREMLGLKKKASSMEKFAQELLPEYFQTQPSIMETKSALELATYDGGTHGSNGDERRPKALVDYRKGDDSKNCGNCRFSTGGSCKQVWGTINAASVCNLHKPKVNEMTKKANAIIGRNHGHIFNTFASEEQMRSDIANRWHSRRREFLDEQERKYAENSMGASLSALLDGEVEENKRLREEVAELRGALEAVEAGQGAMPSNMIPSVTSDGAMPGANPANPNAPGSQPQQIGGPPQAGAPMGAQEAVPMPPEGAKDMPGMPVPMGQPNQVTGDPTMQVNPVPPQPQPGQGGGAMQFMAPAAAMIDPSQVQMEAQQQLQGQQMQQQMQQDLAMLQTELTRSEQELAETKKERDKLKDENRALHMITEPEDLKGSARKLYDRAGTQTSNQQVIPDEATPNRPIDKEEIRRLIGDAFKPQQM